MTEDKKSYYYEMTLRNRLMPIRREDKLVGLLTFYIGSVAEHYVRDNPWSVLEDEPNTGTVCFIDQLITDKSKDNPNHSFAVWRTFKNFIRTNFPQVRVIRWNRFKEGKRYVYYCSASE